MRKLRRFYLGNAFPCTLVECVSGKYRDLPAPRVIRLFSVRCYRRAARRSVRSAAEFSSGRPPGFRARGENPWKCLPAVD